MTERELIKLATENMKKAYAPYSHFTVGAALLTKGGKVYSGANVENASYGATVCAERVALFSAIIDGERQFSVLALSGGKNLVSNKNTLPCGVCLQALSEFCGKDFKILIADGSEDYKTFTLGELLPKAFCLEK